MTHANFLLFAFGYLGTSLVINTNTAVKLNNGILFITALVYLLCGK
jgi:hypothetical protein